MCIVLEEGDWCIFFVLVLVWYFVDLGVVYINLWFVIDDDIFIEFVVQGVKCLFVDLIGQVDVEFVNVEFFDELVILVNQLVLDYGMVFGFYFIVKCVDMYVIFVQLVIIELVEVGEVQWCIVIFYVFIGMVGYDVDDYSDIVVVEGLDQVVELVMLCILVCFCLVIMVFDGEGMCGVIVLLIVFVSNIQFLQDWYIVMFCCLFFGGIVDEFLYWQQMYCVDIQIDQVIKVDWFVM